jgi:hypothetical protein
LARDSASTTLLLIPILLAGLFFARRLGMGTALALALAFHGLDQRPMLMRFIRFTDLAAAVDKTNFAVPPPPLPGPEPWRVFDPDRANPNNAMLLGYDNLYGDESVPMRSFSLLMSALKNAPGRTMDFLDLFNVRYIFHHSKLESSVPGDQVTVYVNRGAFPRAWLVGRSVKVADDGEAFGLLTDPGFQARTEVALGVDAGLSGAPPQGGVTWLDRSPEAYSLAVSTDRAAALVLSNFWYPSWRASVDGRDTQVLKADGGLQAVLLGAGRHRVDFRFDTRLFYDAQAACLAGLMALMGLFWYDAPVQAPKTGKPHVPRS